MAIKTRSNSNTRSNSIPPSNDTNPTPSSSSSTSTKTNSNTTTKQIEKDNLTILPSPPPTSSANTNANATGKGEDTHHVKRVSRSRASSASNSSSTTSSSRIISPGGTSTRFFASKMTPIMKESANLPTPAGSLASSPKSSSNTTTKSSNSSQKPQQTVTFITATLENVHEYFTNMASNSSSSSHAMAFDQSLSTLDIFRPKRSRTSQEQYKALTEFFETNPTPDTVTRTHLAEKLGMTPRAVQIWFQNRRATVKKRKLAAESGAPLSVSMSSSATNSLSTSASGKGLKRVHSEPTAMDMVKRRHSVAVTDPSNMLSKFHMKIARPVKQNSTPTPQLPTKSQAQQPPAPESSPLLSFAEFLAPEDSNSNSNPNSNPNPTTTTAAAATAALHVPTFFDPAPIAPSNRRQSIPTTLFTPLAPAPTPEPIHPQPYPHFQTPEHHTRLLQRRHTIFGIPSSPIDTPFLYNPLENDLSDILEQDLHPHLFHPEQEHQHHEHRFDMYLKKDVMLGIGSDSPLLPTTTQTPTFIAPTPIHRFHKQHTHAQPSLHRSFSFPNIFEPVNSQKQTLQHYQFGGQQQLPGRAQLGMSLNPSLANALVSAAAGGNGNGNGNGNVNANMGNANMNANNVNRSMSLPDIYFSELVNVGDDDEDDEEEGGNGETR